MGQIETPFIYSFSSEGSFFIFSSDSAASFSIDDSLDDFQVLYSFQPSITTFAILMVQQSKGYQLALIQTPRLSPSLGDGQS